MTRGRPRAGRGTRHARALSLRGTRATLLAPALGVVLGLVLGLVAPLATPSPAEAASRWRYPTGTEAERICDHKVCVHRVTSGRHRATREWAELTLSFARRSWTTWVDELGFREPAGSPDAHGDERLHIYLADVPDEQYGATTISDALPGQPRRARSWIAVDNDMAGYHGSPRANLASTIAHEFAHASQINTDLAEDVWFMEATATWAETQVFPEWPTNRRYLREGQQGRRTVPLDSANAGYGNFVLLERLTRVAGRDAVRQVWERLDASTGARDEWSLQAIAAVVQAHGTSWNDFYTGFALANAVPSRFYPSRAAGRAGTPQRAVALGTRNRSSEEAARLPHLSARTSTFTLSSKSRKRRVQLTVRTSHRRHTGVALVVVRSDGTLRRVPLRFSAKGTARVKVLVKRKRTKRLLLVTTNTSRAYRECGTSSGWACDGLPVHDRIRVAVHARVVG